MLPIQVKTGLADERHQVVRCILLTDAVVWACAEDQPVLGLLLCCARYPALGVEVVGVGVCLCVVESWVGCGDNHRTCVLLVLVGCLPKSLNIPFFAV